MGITEQILKAQLDCDYYYDKKPDFISGLAQKAVDEGFEALSAKQQAILEPHLTQACDGVTEPGGYHNNCEAVLEGEELLTAYESQGYYDALLCQDCIDEKEEYDRQWERISRE